MFLSFSFQFLNSKLFTNIFQVLARRYLQILCISIPCPIFTNKISSIIKCFWSVRAFVAILNDNWSLHTCNFEKNQLLEFFRIFLILFFYENVFSQ